MFYPSDSLVAVSDRNMLNGHRSCLLWFTGLSGSGKSTIARRLDKVLYDYTIRSYVLDGDNIRLGLNNDLGLNPKDRVENLRRIAEVAKLMVDAGIVTITAFISPFKETRQFVKDLMSDYPAYEIYIKCPLEVCKQRDPKGLYRKAKDGEITNMTGISAPYDEPDNPDLVIDTSKYGLEACISMLLRFLLAEINVNL